MAWTGVLVLMGPAAATPAPQAGGRDPATALKASLKDPSRQVRLRGLRRAAEHSELSVLKALQAALKHPDDLTAGTACTALARLAWGMKPPERGAAVKLLSGTLKVNALRRPWLAAGAAQALGKLGDARAVPALLDQIEAKDGSVAWAAIDALRAIGAPDAVEGFLKLATKLAHDEAGTGKPLHAGDPERRERHLGTEQRALAALEELIGAPRPDHLSWKKWWKQRENEVRKAWGVRTAWRPTKAEARPTFYGAREHADELPPIPDAIRRGCEYLFAEMEQWPGPDAGPNERMPRYRPILLLALAMAGHAGHPGVRHQAKRMAERDFTTSSTGVYEVSMEIMALERIDGARHQVAIARRAWWLVNAQTKSGFWAYRGPTAAEIPGDLRPTQLTKSRFPGVKLTGRDKVDAEEAPRVVHVKHAGRRPADRGIFGMADLSNTQFAVLGLHAAERAHVRCPAETWKRIQSLHIKTQRRGGWAYQPGNSNLTVSMTAGGLSSLACVREVLDDVSAERDAAVIAGFKALEGWKLLELMDKGRALQRDNTFTGSRFFYWIWSLERACALWRKDTIAGIDWFQTIGHALAASQSADGGWAPANRHTQPREPKLMRRAPRPGGAGLNTAFAVLFLAKAIPAQRDKPVVLSGGPGDRKGDRKEEDD